MTIDISEKTTESQRNRPVQIDEAIRRKTFFEQSRDGIVILDHQGCVYESNQKFADMLGYPLREMDNLNVFDWECFHPRDNVIEMLRSVDNMGHHFETRHKRKDGSIYDVEITTNAAMFDGQKLIFCNCRDITKRKQINDALQQSEARNRALLDAIPDLMFTFNRDGIFVDYHAPPGTKLIADPSFFLGKNIYEVLPFNLADMTAVFIRKVFREKKVALYHYNAIVDGEEKIFESRMTPIGDDTVLSIIRDITQIQKAQKALTESQSRLNLALEVAKIGYWLWEFPTSKVHWFPGHEKLFGISMEEFGGTIDAVQRIVHPNDREHGILNLQKAIKEEQPFDNTYRVIHPDGSIHWLNSFGHVYWDDMGQPLHIFGITKEITDQKRLENILLETSEREQQRLGQELHDNLCQDLKSIEIEIALCESMLKAKGLPEADKVALLGGKINMAVQNAYALAKNMLPVGVDEKGLGEALKALALKMNKDSPAKINYSIDLKCIPDNKISAYHLYRIAQEALSNAARHSGASKIDIFWGRHEKKTDQICLKIGDNGCGFLNQKSSTTGMGIEVMKSRAGAIDAYFKIVKNKGRGTMVSCVVSSQERG